MLHSIIREATAKSKDGRIDQADFLNYSASTTRYSLFSPMEVSIIFHFAGRGNGSQRLALVDFAQLLDPRWKSPYQMEKRTAAATATASKTSGGIAASSFLSSLAQSVYNFVQGGFAGAFGATIVYPIDLGKTSF